MRPQRLVVFQSLLLLGAGVLVGYLLGTREPQLQGQATEESAKPVARESRAEAADVAHEAGYKKGAANVLPQSPPATADRPANDYGLGELAAANLLPYPPGGPGTPTPL